jgi:hypothetical protein
MADAMQGALGVINSDECDLSKRLGRPWAISYNFMQGGKKMAPSQLNCV